MVKAEGASPVPSVAGESDEYFFPMEEPSAGQRSPATAKDALRAAPVAAEQGLPGRSRPPEDIDVARRAVRVDVPELAEEDCCSICLEEYCDSDPAVVTSCK